MFHVLTLNATRPGAPDRDHACARGSSSRRGAVLLCLLAACSTNILAETLREAIELTLRTNPDVRIDVARRMANQEAENQAIGGYLPRVDLALGRGKQQPDNVTTQATYGEPISQKKYDRSLTISQMLFDGFGTSSEVDRNRARVESAARKLAFTSEQTSLKAIEAYLEVLRQVEVIRLTKDNVAVHKRTYDQIKLRASSGVGRKSDQDQIEARLALANSNLIAAEANLIVAKVNYKLVVGEKPGELTKPPLPDLNLLPRSPEDAMSVALANNHILRSAKADVDAADAQHRSAKAALYPRFDFEMGVQHNDLVSTVDSNRDNNKYAMVRMRYNLFKGGSDVARVGETQHLSYEAKEILERASRQLEQSVRLSWNAFKSALDRLPDLRKHAEASLLTREAYTKQFSLGQRTLLDLLDSENEYYTASTNLLNGEFVELFSRYRMFADMGMLLDTLGVAHLEEADTSAR
jgi:adhesin transport system outer membrane protein